MNPHRFGALAAAVVLAGCVSVPTAPTTLALPGTNKGFDQFRFDEGDCRQHAYDSVGGVTAARAQEDAGVRSTFAGAAIGALIGGAISGGHGAAVGAGIGGASGAIAGIGAGEVSSYEAQRRYDNAYTRCMYAKGHRVAVSGRFAPSVGTTYHPPAPPRYSYGYPPPPVHYSYRYPPPPPPPGYGSPAPPYYYPPPR